MPRTLDCIFDRLDAPPEVHADEMLRDARERLGLEHGAYLAFNLPSPLTEGAPVSIAMGRAWRVRVVQGDYTDTDPLETTSFRGVLPVEWSDLDREQPLVRRMFEAVRLVGARHGMTIPIRGRHGELGLFFAGAGTTTAEWQARRRIVVSDLTALAYVLHDAVVAREGVTRLDWSEQFTERERDCLIWAARGKTSWETAEILSMPERNVRFHLECARAKLGALNTVNAVAKAIAYGVIVSP